VDGVSADRDSMDVGSYRYKLPWLMLVWPLFGLLGLALSWSAHVSAAIGISAGVEVLMVLVYLEYATYSVRLGSGTIRAGSCLHHRTFSLVDIDLIQHVYGGKGSQFLFVRRRNRVLLKVSRDLDGFEDLLGLLRAYAHRHRLEFKTRDSWGEWT
jgi:hypothetical protein